MLANTLGTGPRIGTGMHPYLHDLSVSIGQENRQQARRQPSVQNWELTLATNFGNNPCTKETPLLVTQILASNFGL